MKKIMIVTLLQLVVYSAIAIDKKGKATLSGTIEGCEGDTLTLTIHDEKFTGRNFTDGKVYISVVQHNRFAFSVPLTAEFSYATFLCSKRKHSSKALGSYYLCAGDAIMVDIKKDTVIFSGKGAARWQCMYALKRNERIGWSKEEGMRRQKMNEYDQYVDSRNKFDSLAIVRRQITALFENRLTKQDLLRLRTDEAGFRYTGMYSAFSYALMNDTTGAEWLRTVYDKVIRPLPLPPITSYAADSEQYVDALLFRIRFDVIFSTGNFKQEMLMPAMLDKIMQQYKGRLKQKLITECILKRYRKDEDSFTVLQSVLPQLSIKRYRDIVEDIIAHRMPGKPAYPFELPDVNGNMVRYTDYKDKAVVLSVWVSGCSYCVGFEKRMQPIREEFAGKNVAFISISGDWTKEEWLAGLKTNLYTDSTETNLFAGGKGNAFSDHYGIYSFPTMIILGRNGKVVSTTPPQPYTKDDKQKVRQLIIEAMK